MNIETYVFIILSLVMCSMIVLIISATQSVNDELKEGKEKNGKR